MTDPRSSSSLLPRLEAAADCRRSITFVTGATDSAAYTTEAVEWARVHDDARAMAAELQARGVEPGHSVGLIGPTSRDLVTAIQASWLTGARGRDAAAADAHGLDRGVHRADPRPHVERRVPDRRSPTPSSSRSSRPEPTDPPMVTLDELRAAVADARQPTRTSRPADDPNALAILQFTSGSTAERQGRDAPAPVRHREHRRDRRARSSSTTTSTARSSWLPLYHDMGLIGMLMIPMTTGTDLVLAGPAGLPRRTVALGAVDLGLPVHASPRARTSRTRSPPARCAAAATWT